MFDCFHCVWFVLWHQRLPAYAPPHALHAVTHPQGADDLRRIQDLDLDAEAEAARMAVMEAEGRAEEEEYAEDMAALQEVMGQPLPSTRGCVLQQL